MGTLDEERVKRIRSQSGDRQLVSSSYQSTFSEWVARKVLERSGCEADQLGGEVQGEVEVVAVLLRRELYF